MSIEYRVVWKRDGCDRKTKRYVSKARAERFMALLGPDPFTAGKAYGHWPPDAELDDIACCSGHECACGGLTIREHLAEERKDMPMLEWCRLETREVGKWAPSTTQQDRQGEV